MKFNSIVSDKILNKVRYNKNVYGKPLQIKKGKEDIDKKDYASIMILNLMDERGFFDIVFKQVENPGMRGL